MRPLVLILAVIASAGLAYFILPSRVPAPKNAMGTPGPPPPEDLPEEVTLISLFAPVHGEDLAAEKKYSKKYHGFTEIGRATLKDRTDIKAVMDSISLSRKNSTGDLAKCFEPRHAVVYVKHGETTEYAFCFHCKSWKLFLPGKDDIPPESFGTDARDVFNKLLKREGVALSPGAEGKE